MDGCEPATGEHYPLQVYDEDVIRHEETRKLGIVIKTCRDNDSSDEDSMMSDDEDMEKVDAGKVMVGWYNLKSRWNDDEEVEVVDENVVGLVDRSLLPGDVVRWVPTDKGNQKGQVTKVSVLVDCRIIGTDHVLRNIDVSQLMPLLKYVSMAPVVKGPWMGVIKAVLMELTLRLKNGSRCIITGDAINSISDVTDQRDESSTYYCADFYPGQQVQATARIFKEAKWISGTRPAISNQGRLTAIIEDVVVDSLDVDWQVCGYTGSQEGSLTQPEAIISRNELNAGEVKVLNHFNEAHIQIGDKAYYVLREADVKFCKESVHKAKKDKLDVKNQDLVDVVGGSDGAHVVEQVSNEEEDCEDSDYETEPAQRHNSTPNSGGAANSRQVGSRPRRRRHLPIQKKKKRYQPPVLMLPGEKVCVEVCYTKTKVNTVWQDSSVQEGVVSTDLHPVIHLDELEFFPGDFVVDTRMNSAHQHDLGVIQSADFEARLCSVKWLTFHSNSETGCNSNEVNFKLEERVSVYDIKDHEDFMFRVGDIVVRLSPNNTKSSQKEDVPTTPLAPAGQIMKVNKDGTIQVLWVDCSVSSVYPSQLYVVNEEDMEWESDTNVSDNSEGEWEGEDEWETASDASEGEGGEGNVEALSDLGVVMRSLNALHTLATSNDVDINQRTAQFINALEEQFSPIDWTAASSEASSGLVNDIGEKSIADQQSAGSQVTEREGSESHSNEGTRENLITGLSTGENTTAATSSETSAGNASQSIVHQRSGTTNVTASVSTRVLFLSLEAVPRCHHYINQTHNPHNPRSFNAALMRDLKLLQTDLPQGISVKVFEDRTDLYSALIAGPPGTPYEDGLFYFDMQLPDNYPASPPHVHYHSFCSSRLNPNLYEGGKVCVSLLGTWAGTGSEKWTSKSTLQQLLLSIQGLILNEEPYFNEAGYEKHRTTPEGKENSRMYNEMAVIKMLQSIQLMLVRPPEIFRDEVVAHFKERSESLLSRFDGWLKCDGTTNEYNKDLIPSFPLFPLSKGFCTTISRILENLRTALRVPPFT